MAMNAVFLCGAIAAFKFLHLEWQYVQIVQGMLEGEKNRMSSIDRTQVRHYEFDGKRYFSVSTVCEVITGKCDFYAPSDAERGTDLHLIFALAVGHHAGLCDAPDVPTEYDGYYIAILKWIGLVNPQPSSIERRMRHTVYPYAGTPDFIGTIGEHFGVLDLKTGDPAKWHRVQICAYQKMLDKAAKQWILYISNDGTFKQVLVKPSPREWAVFMNGLSLLQWRESA